MAQVHAAPGELIDIGPLGAGLANQLATAIMKSAQLELVRRVLHRRHSHHGARDAEDGHTDAAH